jgi:hypothetical protein
MLHEQEQPDFVAEKDMLADEYNELADECITDVRCKENEDDMIQILDTYRYLYSKYQGYRISRAKAADDLRRKL